MTKTSITSSEMCKLAQRLQNLWFDMKFWAPIIISRHEDYRFGIDREGNFYLGIFGDASNPKVRLWTNTRLILCDDDPSNTDSYREFNNALLYSHCTIKDLEDTISLIMEKYCLPYAYYRIFKGKITRFWRRLRYCFGKLPQHQHV